MVGEGRSAAVNPTFSPQEPAPQRTSPEKPMGRAVPIKKALELVLKEYEGGRLAAAASICSHIIAAKPRLAAAQNLMGIVLNAQGKRKEAAKSLQRAVNLAPKNALFLANLGEVQRLRGKLPEAMAALTQAVRISPKAAQAHNNLGIVHFERKEYKLAIESYQRALLANKRFAEAHNNIGNALRALGRRDEAIDSYRKALKLRDNYAEAYNNMAIVLRETGDLHEAESSYRKAIEHRKDYLDAHCNLAGLLVDTGRSPEALRVLAEALKIKPTHVSALVKVAQIQLKHQNLGAAARVARLAVTHSPDNIGALLVSGHIFQESDHLNFAVGCYRKVLEFRPRSIEANYHLGVCLKALGGLDEARDSFKRVIDLNKGGFAAYPLLAEVSTFTPDDPILLRMEEVLQAAENQLAPQLMPLHFALGKAYEDLGQHDRSFKHYKTGAALKRSQLNYREDVTLARFDQIRRIFDAAFFRSAPFDGVPSDVPVFIVGMPRSGSTLVEKIIAGHPDAHGAGEIRMLSRQLNALRGRFPNLPQYPQLVTKMGAVHYRIVAEGYLKKVQARAPKALRITDKMLTNANLLGLVHTLFPKAKIIHACRDPMDSCLSAYTKLFMDEMPFTYDLGELGRYCRKHNELMAHWGAVLPAGTIKTVRYEDLVADPPRVAREVIDFIGLPWSDTCLDFHQKLRPSETASIAEAKRPILDGSVGRWRRHEKDLAPLMEALGEAG
jgi:tetratricopeptide (TPR) repeat protein